LASVDIKYGDNVTLQQIIDKRLSFLKEQINPTNKPEVNSTFQRQIDAIRSVDDIELIEPIILKKKAQLMNSKDVHESDNSSSDQKE
jgi:hypothetical protein